MVRLVLHAPGQPGMWLLLVGVFGLVVLLGGIGLIGLVGHGQLGTPIIPAANVDRSTARTSSSVIRPSSSQSLHTGRSLVRPPTTGAAACRPIWDAPGI